ncbi:translation initiation factor eIF-2B subunit epsilon [Danaus plexippus plexippus]|uniref:Translation initiation factor eIF2B subunit epsilon n=1 Tax=Danaus plexippus plexippus TaxID=278856 RepID=A0A212F4G7_DANPL|nr:translation initiation factor eIF-2B subunit epsilon [Danaus plexippus plexippus]
MENDKENVVQAVVVMDLFNNNFLPINSEKPMGLLQVAGIPLIDYTLESLFLGGVGEALLFCCQDGNKIKDHIKKCKEDKALWSTTMEVQVVMSDTCQTMGDVMREIDAAGLVRGHFVLLGVNSITNMNFAMLLEKHKQTCKKDKGAAMTIVYKEVAWEHPLIYNDNSVLLAADGNTHKILMHEKHKPKSKKTTISLPLECVLNHSEVKLHHNLVDPGIALCSPSVPPLFSDNFDFQNRNDFIYGILINEDILASSLYYALLGEKQYAAAITNWKTYQTVCWDILHNWVYPLSIETGSFYQNTYLSMGNHNFRKTDSTLSRSCSLLGDVLIGEKSHISDMTKISKSIVGNNCMIGKEVVIQGSHLMDNVIVKDNTRIINSFIDEGCTIEDNCNLEGVIASNKICIKSGSILKGNILGDEQSEDDRKPSKSTLESGTEWENESSREGDDEFIGFEKDWSASDSCYSSESSVESLSDSPIPEDTNIFLQEVIDSLARGYDDKLKCDFLILEINSSRYAYNIQLHEVNFFVVRALLSLPVLAESKSVLSSVKDTIKFFRPVLANYIKTKSSIMDCLKAVEESCLKNEWLDGKAGQVIHLLYEADVVDEDSLLEWFEDLKENESPLINQTSVVKFFDWLQEASEESDDSD